MCEKFEMCDVCKNRKAAMKTKYKFTVYAHNYNGALIDKKVAVGNVEVKVTFEDFAKQMIRLVRDTLNTFNAARYFIVVDGYRDWKVTLKDMDFNKWIQTGEHVREMVDSAINRSSGSTTTW
jgi:hypothetical protein